MSVSGVHELDLKQSVNDIILDATHLAEEVAQK